MSDKKATKAAPAEKTDKANAKKADKPETTAAPAESKGDNKKQSTKPEQKKQEPQHEAKTEKAPEEHKEEHKGEGEQGEGEQKQFKKKRGYKEKVRVTLETVIPELPKKGERLSEPNDTEFHAEVEKLREQIVKIKEKMHDAIKDERKKLGATNKETESVSMDVKDKLKEKQDQIKTLNAQLTALWDQMTTINAGLEEYYEKSNKLRNKMIVILPADKMKEELRELKDKQSKGTITMFEEKKVVRQIAELEASIPHAEPLQELEKKFAGIKKEKKELSQLIFKAKETRERYRAEEKDLKALLDKNRAQREKVTEEKIPAIDKIREDYKNKVNDLKHKIKELEQANYDAWNKYEAQQEQIKEIQWMKKIQDRLKREEQYKKRMEEQEKLRQAEEEQYKDIPYREEIEICERLLSYCQKLLPQEEQKEKAPEKDKYEVQKEILKSDQWKKEKLEVIVSRKDKEDDFQPGKAKKNKNQDKKKPQGPINQALNHQMETLNYFDLIKTSPPMHVNRLPDTISQLKEKREYYKQLSEQEEKGEKKAENKEENKQDNKKSSPKKENKSVSLNESEFPSMS